jgi:hypothetical protein
MMFDAEHQMRTTLTIDNDVLDAAKVLARHRNSSLGSVISDLARRALAEHRPQISPPQAGCSLPVLTRHTHGVPVDLALVNQLRDE